MKRFLPMLLASAALSFSLASCSNREAEEDMVSTDDSMTTAMMSDTTGGKKSAALRELNAQNATEDIKKMQEQM